MDPLERVRQQKEELHKLAYPDKDEQPGEEDKTGEEGKTDLAPDKPVETQPAAAAPATPVETAKTVDEDTFSHKYSVLLGKYNAEVPRLHDNIRRLTSENTELKRQVAELQAAPKQPELDDEGKQIYRSPHVPAELRTTSEYKGMAEEYGISYAERQYEAAILAAKTTVKPVEERVDTVQADTAKQLFDEQLTGLVPNWKALDDDPEFYAWSMGVSPGTGATYNKLLNDAYHAGDLRNTAAIFQLYEQLTHKPPAPTPKPATPVVPEHLASPHKTGGGTQTLIDNNKGQVLRMADFEQLYLDYNAGKYQNREAEYQTKKREFMKAKEEGRLV